MDYRGQIINNYLSAYNSYDIKGMLKDLHPNIKFENVSNGEVNMTINGLAAFKQQAEQATAFFTSREQTVTDIKHDGDTTEISVAYHAVLAVDLPNGLGKGDTLNLTGKSVFKFEGNKISAIKDIS